MNVLSFEAHITIEPVFGERFDEFERCCAGYKFKPAELLLQKQRQVTPIRSNKDSFCTGHGKDYTETLERILKLVADLKESGFEVWRYKIEGILVDVHMERLVKIHSEGVKVALKMGLDVDRAADCDGCGKTYASKRNSCDRYIFCTFCGVQFTGNPDVAAHTCRGKETFFKTKENLRALKLALNPNPWRMTED
jgi:hypothetical protein